MFVNFTPKQLGNVLLLLSILGLSLAMTPMNNLEGYTNYTDQILTSLQNDDIMNKNSLLYKLGFNEKTLTVYLNQTELGNTLQNMYAYRTNLITILNTKINNTNIPVKGVGIPSITDVSELINEIAFKTYLYIIYRNESNKYSANIQDLNKQINIVLRNTVISSVLSSKVIPSNKKKLLIDLQFNNLIYKFYIDNSNSISDELQVLYSKLYTQITLLYQPTKTL